MPQGTPITSHAAILGPASQSQTKKSGALAAVLLAMAAAGAGVGLGAVFYLRSQPAAPAASTAPERVSTEPAPASSASASPTIDRVTIQLFAASPITLVRGEGVSSVAFTKEGATFQLPRGDAPVEIEIQLESGETEKRTLTPDEDAALRLTQPAASASAAPSAAPAAAPILRPGGGRAGAGASKGEGGLKKNPYQ